MGKCAFEAELAVWWGWVVWLWVGLGFWFFTGWVLGYLAMCGCLRRNFGGSGRSIIGRVRRAQRHRGKPDA